MIISHQRRSVFVHVPKTGGRSISEFLQVDWPDAQGKKLRIPVEAEADIRDLAKRNPQLIWNAVHLPASELRLRLPDWDKYKSFAFVRNPWDRVVSLYAHFGGGLHFTDFVLSPPRDVLTYIKPQVYYLTDSNGKILVSFVGRFERLEQDFAFINPSLRVLKRMNVSRRDADYRHYHNRETRACIADRYHADITTFGYEY